MKSAKQKRCVISICGHKTDLNYLVDIWFDSLKSVVNVLSQENQRLLKVAAEQKPQPVSEVAALTRCAVSNVSRTLKNVSFVPPFNFNSNAT